MFRKGDLMMDLFIFAVGAYIGGFIGYSFRNDVKRKSHVVKDKKYLINDSLINVTGREIELYDNEEYIGSILPEPFMLKIKSVEPVGWFKFPALFTIDKKRFTDSVIKMRGYCQEKIEGIEECDSNHDYIVTRDVAEFIIRKGGVEGVGDIYHIDGDYNSANGLVFVYTNRFNI